MGRTCNKMSQLDKIFPNKKLSRIRFMFWIDKNLGTIHRKYFIIKLVLILWRTPSSSVITKITIIRVPRDKSNIAITSIL